MYLLYSVFSGVFCLFVSVYAVPVLYGSSEVWVELMGFTYKQREIQIIKIKTTNDQRLVYQ